VTAKLTWCLALAIAMAGCGRGAGDQPHAKRVIVLGFDGMDYALTKQLMDEGRLPNLRRLAAAGSFAPLETAIPPQSPVAWSNFMTGMDAGGHGIFDFIHRDPRTMLPYLSTTRTSPGTTWRFGQWLLPVSGGKVELLRHGKAVWEDLTQRGIRTTIVRVPANFPPAGTATLELSGMGTPDLLGTYGTFTFFTADPSVTGEKEVSGGRIVAAHAETGVFKGVLLGPDNPFHVTPKPVTTEFALHADPDKPWAELVAGGEERLLHEGEWSDWVPVDFPLAPLRSLRGMCRFYLKQLRPVFQLYVTPVNLDPMQPALPISAPESWATELARATGRYYTQGIPQDTKAYSAGVFEPREFLAQTRLVLAEDIEQYHYVLGRFDGGLLFFYFGEPDETSHMMWRPMDPAHPAYDAERDAPYANVVKDLYATMDSVAGYTLEHMDSTTTLVILSDHGFTSWRRTFHLNAWLASQGYLMRLHPEAESGSLADIDWAHTRAYGLGLNGLYINLQGRESGGIVAPADRAALVQEIAAKLEHTIDPATGSPAITRTYRPEETYATHDALDVGPDLIVGYAKGTRCANESALGGTQVLIFTDNTDAWSGDHCMDHTAVPGVLFTNRPLRRPAPRLQDVGAAVAAEFDAK
jgi:predicted AlkP superfamily phosphohydrolase/phosphomutase